MKFLKKIWEWLKNPQAWWFAVIFVFFVGVLVGIVLFIKFFGMGTGYDAVAYILYALSAVLLAYVIYCLVYLVPRAVGFVKDEAQKHEFTRNIIEHYGFRTIVFSIVSFAVSAAFAIYNGTLGIIYLSVWHIALGVYYLFLAVMRGGILLFHNGKRKKREQLSPEQIKFRETRTYLICGFILVLLPVALSGAIWEMYASARTFVRLGLMIYLAAAYTTYKVVMTVYNFVKSRRSDDMTVRAVRNINVADTLVSVLALQAAMFHEFSPEASMSVGNAVMGAIICAVTVLVGIFMIVRGITAIRRVKNT